VSQGSAVIAHRAERGCLLDPAGPRCFSPAPDVHVLGGRFLVGPSGDSIYDTLSLSEMRLDEDCRWRAVATLVEPPRALFACLHEDEVRWASWSPDGIRTRFSMGNDWFPTTFERDTRVVPLELSVRLDALVSHWFDLVSERLIVTPPLAHLFPQQSFGPRIVAESEDDGRLYLLDVEAATLVPLLPDTGCQYPLVFQDASDQHALVACPKASMGDHVFLPDTRPSHYEWLELFDFRTRRRLRSDQVFEARLTGSGIPVGIQPGAVSTLAALTWPSACASR